MDAKASYNHKKTHCGWWQLYHNLREYPDGIKQKTPDYIISTAERNEYSTTLAEAQALKKQFIREGKEAYERNRTGGMRKFQAKAYEWSAVVNIKDTTTMADLKNLTAHINKKYGFRCYNIAIHRDEGYLVSLKNKNEKLTAKTDFIFDRKTGIYYKDKAKTQILANNIDELKKEYKIVNNHHAHLEFITLDKETGRNRQREVRAKKLCDLQDETAQILGMKRGISYYKNKQKMAEMGVKFEKYDKPQRIEPRKFAEKKAKENKIKNIDNERATINEARIFYNIELDKLRERDEKDSAKFKAERAKFEALCAKIKSKALSKADLKKEYSKEPKAEIESARTATPQMPQNRALSDTKLKNKAELESKTTQNRAVADTKTAAPIQPKSAEVTPSAEKTPKIEQPTFNTLALRAISRADNETAQTLSFEIKESFAMSKTAKMHENTAKKYAESLTKQGMKAQIYQNQEAERADFSFGVIFAKTSEALALAIEYMKSKLGLTNKEPEIPTQKPKENEISNPTQTKEIKTLNNKPKINEKSKNKQKDSYGMSM